MKHYKFMKYINVKPILKPSYTHQNLNNYSEHIMVACSTQGSDISSANNELYDLIGKIIKNRVVLASPILDCNL